MNWVLGFLIGLICAVAGCVAAGFIADLCTRWYHISSFEGGAGYYVIFIALGGLIAGFLIGAAGGLSVLLRGGGFGKAVGFSMAIVASVAVISLGLAWLFGDIPPKIRGNELYVEVELRCPPDWQPNNKVRAGDNYMTLRSLGMNNSIRYSRSERLEWAEARQEDGRTIFRETVFLFTSTGKRLLDFTLGGDNVTGFLMPLPGHPNAEQEQWSDWLPREDPSNATGGFRYRFRVVREDDWNREQEAEKARRHQERIEAFGRLRQDSPMEQWLMYCVREGETWDDQDAAMNQKAITMVRTRPEEVVALVQSADIEIAGRAMDAIGPLEIFPLSAEPALRETARITAQRIEQYNANFDKDDPDTVAAGQLKEFFMKWISTWERLMRERHVGIPPELAQIREAALNGPKETEIEAIASLTDYYQKEWDEPLTVKP